METQQGPTRAMGRGDRRRHARSRRGGARPGRRRLGVDDGMLVLRQEPDQEPRRRGRRRPEQCRRGRERAGLDEHGRTVRRRRLQRLRCRLVLGQVEGAEDEGRNYFFGGTTTAATTAKASIGTQTIKLPAGAARHKVTLSGWLGNYGTNTTQVRAQFTDAAGKTLAALRIGPDTTIGGSDMAFRSGAAPSPRARPPSSS